MKLIIELLAVIAAIFLLLKLFRKKKENVEQDNLNHEAWVSTKKASDRISSDDMLNKKYASNKIEIPESKKSERLVEVISLGNQSLSEMDRLRNVIKNESVVLRIDQIIKITSNIMKDAIDDPNDIPQIKRFFTYYLPTTIKLLNSYHKLESNDIISDNIDKTKSNIEEMLDVVIKAFNKRLNSLFDNQAMDIETDIDVMNQMLTQEGLVNNSNLQTMEGNK